jgi:C-terminal processing protease CtpA/Prc
MNASPNHGRALRQTLKAAIIAAAALPVLASAADADSDRRQREFDELRLEREQAIAQREMQQRERIQQDALRSQQQILQRQEQRLDEMRSRLDEASRQYAEAASDFGRSFNYGVGSTLVSPAPPPRALIGVSIDTAERRDGALVQTVSPGGAAEEAGIRSGDLITALDGKDLTKEPNPGRALVEALQNVKPDTKVKLAVLRDGRRMTFDVTTRAAPAVAMRSLPDLRELESRIAGIRGRSNVPDMMIAVGDGSTRFGGMEFATLSERLGNYFGVKSGVLVVRAGANAPFSLQDGDVILSIDGRVPTSAQHAGRILRSYQPGEKVKLRVQRDRKAIDIDGTAPDSRN